MGDTVIGAGAGVIETGIFSITKVPADLDWFFIGRIPRSSDVPLSQRVVVNDRVGEVRAAAVCARCGNGITDLETGL